MLRSILISLSKAKWAQNLVTRWKFAWRFASRFIAGKTLEEAVQVVRTLNEIGMIATLDQLGENTTSTQEASKARDGVLEILKAIQENHLHCNVSIKLSQVGLVVDESLCRENMRLILDAAAASDCFVRIDMEDSGLTEKTIGVFRWALDSGYRNVGIVIQSYLFRSESDVRGFSDAGARVRLCKGAYKEPAAVAFPAKADVDRNYDNLSSLLLDISQNHSSPLLHQDGKFPPIPALATHDPQRIEYALKEMEKREMPKTSIEFQMLYGIRRDLQEKLAADGYPVRIYVPFGTHWFPYFMRRLAERPANLWFFIYHFFKK